MAKVKIINRNLDQNLNGSYFNNTPSETVFSFGRFFITSNFDGRTYVDYNNRLSSFVREVTLETLGLTETQSQIITTYNTNAVLNLDKSDLNTFIRFGSAYEYLRVCIETIILNYPASLFVSAQINSGGNITYYDYNYDITTDVASFKIPTIYIKNTFGISYNYGNLSKPDDKEIRNLNLSYDKYIVWTSLNSTGNTFNVLEYTGNSSGRNYISLKVHGNPFYMVTGTSAQINFHIKPNNFIFEEYRALLNQYEKYIVSTRNGTNGFKFILKEPILLDDGNISYVDTTLLWNTSDGYNVDIDTPVYKRFLEALLNIGIKYDKVKTDLIARFLTPASIKQYDLTDDGKVAKLLRIYGKEFDQLREFIDSLVYIDRVSYDKVKNVPDQLVKNLARTFGWNYFSLVNEEELVESFLTVDSQERDLNENLLPAEIDIELWRRIIINSSYFWKTKGTREAIKSIFLMIGIPEPFINITEYVYTVDGKINPNSVTLQPQDFISNSLPFDNYGYPKAPLESSNYYFQMSGNTDSGQAYMNVFRQAGFNLIRTIDNKKSWSESGSTYRIDDDSPQYHQLDSKLVLNTKEVDIALDTARGIEYDTYDYIQRDFTVNSSGYTLPYSYVNVSLGYDGSENTFPLPPNYMSDRVLGRLEVRFNGILLNGTNVDDSFETYTNADYSLDYTTKTFTLLNSMYATNNPFRRDVIQATFIYSGGTHSMSGVTVRYVVTRINADISGTVIPLPSTPSGDIQLTVNGIALTKGTSQFNADYRLDTPNQQIIIQNPVVIAFLADNPLIQVAYLDVIGTNDILSRSEILRVDSFNSNKLYYNISANKYVYKLNYKSNNTSDIKVLINGIALEPNIDYSINPQNLYEVFLPDGIRYGTIISVYYLVGGNSIFNPIVHDVFGVGNISQLSFLEFIELVQRRLINVRNRKTISDFKGGWYPSLLRVYIEYLRRSGLPSNNPLLSNGYTFQNLYSFLSKYNAFFQRFVNELLSSTIILRKSGLLVRNSIFTKQKFMYRRGVNLLDGTSILDNPIRDLRGNNMYYYLGDDSSVFKIGQPPVLPPPELYVETIPATTTLNTITTGGMNVLQHIWEITSYGIQHRRYDNIDNCWTSWERISINSSLLSHSFSTTITNTCLNTCYEYRAFINEYTYGYTGCTLGIMTPPIPLPSISTCVGIADVNSIHTGGRNIDCYQDASTYGIQYRCVGNINTSDILVSPSALTYPANGTSSKIVRISGDSWNTYTAIIDPQASWLGLSTSPSTTLSPTGVNTYIYSSDNNSGISRTGVVCYRPLFGTTKYVTVTQPNV